MTDLNNAVRRYLRDLAPEYYNFRFNSYDGEDGDLFVEVKSTQNSGTGFSVVNVSRQVAMACMEGTDDDVTVHITCMLPNNVVRLTISPDLRELDDEAIRGKIAQSLRIS